MATYEPPTENLAIFDPVVFLTGDEPLTYNIAVKKFLKYPNAQGLENLQAINVNGVAEFNATANFNSTATFDGASQFNSNVNIGSASTANNTPTLTTFKTALVVGSGGNGKIDAECPINVGGFGSINMTTAQLNLSSNSNINQTGGTQNNLNKTTITTSNGASATPALNLIDSVSSNNMLFLPNSGAGSYNPATAGGNQVIVSAGTQNTETLELTTWSLTNSAVKIAPTSVSMGAGGSVSIPTTSVECNGTNVVVNPNIKYPDNTIQNSAFTGAGALSGSYTLSNITLDSNGKITAISNGSAGTQFVPTFHNFANYQTGTSGYSQGAYINWSSGWGALDYVIIRVRSQVNYTINSGEYNSYASTAGELIIRPYYAPAGVIGSLGSPNIFYSTNSGSVVGATKKLIYYTGAVNNGTQSYFFVYGSGGSGGGDAGYIQLMCDAPGTANGWTYTSTYEYLVHSTSGASIAFSNGSGTNNSLP